MTGERERERVGIGANLIKDKNFWNLSFEGSYVDLLKSYLYFAYFIFLRNDVEIFLKKKFANENIKMLLSWNYILVDLGVGVQL